jgi:hypothetical protein
MARSLWRWFIGLFRKPRPKEADEVYYEPQDRHVLDTNAANVSRLEEARLRSNPSPF